jgi:small subunit ribosomal protein S19e
MVSVLEVPADALISRVSEKLKQNGEITPPEWAPHVKTGVHAERKPHSEEWWYVRCASVLRTLYIKPSTGVGRLRTKYGGRKSRGSRPEHHYDASGGILRKVLQQLERAGYVKKEEYGRILTPQGRSLLDKTTNELKVATKEKPKKEVEKIERVRGTAEKKRAGAPRKPAAKPPRAAAKGATGVAKKESTAKAARTRGKRKTGKAKARKS